MGADKHGRKRSDGRKRKRGQSVMEFALLLPVFVGFFYIMIQVESAITTSIVNQKYARMRLNFMSFNNRYYPQNSFTDIGGKLFQRWWVGVDDNINYLVNQPNPVAPERSIGRVSVAEDQANRQEFPGISQRQKVRVRVASFTCLPPSRANTNQYFSEGFLGEDTFLGGNYHYCSQ